MSQNALKEKSYPIVQKDQDPWTYRINKKDKSKIEYWLLVRPLDDEEKQEALNCDFGSEAFAEKALREALVRAGGSISYKDIQEILKVSEMESGRRSSPHTAILRINSFFTRHNLLFAVYPEEYEPKKFSTKDWRYFRFRVYKMEEKQ